MGLRRFAKIALRLTASRGVRIRRVLTMYGIGLALLALAIQLIPVSAQHPSPPRGIGWDTVVQPPGDVRAIWQRACADCHSNETSWPWYGRVAPVSWFLAQHVRKGRRHLNWSDLGATDTVTVRARIQKKLREIRKEIENGRMPLESYVLLHPDARLSEAERGRIYTWIDEELARLKRTAPGDTSTPRA